ncbi:hypothetical protein M419DRAFT_9621 [Trichoderma reesei RUT C-30]|uniref:Uncharacterized protein n=1 Tax=Hypocrea jecorina (strain ATCC 56765 / BCRC 32924 / NRRL 11460 / Rut C-30) TaxID=1344414 RepID=A0A024S902_HYPJR|nr:hypothetical protein M419DRAFT_9621 [Trichoderma reesei RUT C-30]
MACGLAVLRPSVAASGGGQMQTWNLQARVDRRSPDRWAQVHWPATLLGLPQATAFQPGVPK